MTAQAYIATGQAAKAVPLLQDHTGGDPRSVVVLAMAQDAAGNRKAAIATLEPLAKQLPKPGTVGDPRPAASLAVEYGALLMASGRAIEAVAPLQQATQLVPTSEPAWRQLAAALDATNRKPDGDKARLRADELAKQAQEKRSGAAAQAAQAAAAPPPATSGGGGPALSPQLQDKVTRFRALMGLQRYEDAQKLAAEMLAAAPKNPDFLYQMAVVEMAQKRNAAAEKHFQQALEIEPNHVATLDDYAVLLLAQKRNDEARKLVERALKIRPNDPAAKQNLEQLQKPAKG